MARQSRQPSGTGIYHVMMRGINHQNIFEEHEDYYQFLNTLDMMAQSYEPDGTPLGRNYILYAYCLMSNHIHLLIREREISYNKLNDLVNTPLSDDVACLDIEDTSKGRPSDNQVMLLIKEKTGVTNSSAFQQLPEETKRSVLIELTGVRASLRQLERLTGIGKSMIFRM